MILRLSAKLAGKVKVAPGDLEALPLDMNPFADWSAHLFVAQRRQFILVTNTASLYSAVVSGKGTTSDVALVRCLLAGLGKVMREDGFRFHFDRLVAPSSAGVLLAKALNRSVTGSMNELVYLARLFLTEDGLSPYESSFRLNRTPMGRLGYAFPVEAFAGLTPASGDGSSRNAPPGMDDGV